MSLRAGRGVDSGGIMAVRCHTKPFLRMLFSNVRRLVVIDLHPIGKCPCCSTDFNCQANLAHLQNLGDIAALIDYPCDKHLRDIISLPTSVGGTAQAPPARRWGRCNLTMGERRFSCCDGVHLREDRTRSLPLFAGSLTFL